MNGPAPRLILRHVVEKGRPAVASDLLAGLSGLSRSAVKDAMNKGAVWLRRGDRGPRRRLRRARTDLRPGDRVELHYDRALLAQVPPQATLLEDRRDYSVWRKPANLLSQGTDFGDHCSLLRQVERARGKAFLVHRLDREAVGIVVVAHTSKAAGQLSERFRLGEVDKSYRVEVRGRLQEEGVIEQPLDGKPARSEFRSIAYDEQRNITTLEVRMRTGRLHQVRRHLNAVGHPVMGDPRYGRGNKNSSGLCLVATKLQFLCPLAGEEVRFTLPDAPAPGES